MVYRDGVNRLFWGCYRGWGKQAFLGVPRRGDREKCLFGGREEMEGFDFYDFTQPRKTTTLTNKLHKWHVII